MCRITRPGWLSIDRICDPGAKVKLDGSAAGAALPPLPCNFITAPTTRAIRARIIRLERIITAIFAAFSAALFWGSGKVSDIKSSRDGSLYQATAADAQAGHRLDRFLADALSDLSRARIQQLLAEGNVARSGTTIKDANHRVKGGETYTVLVPAAQPARPQGQDIPLEVVYEDKDLIVIEKPAGLVVHPAAGNPDGTLVNALIAHCGAELIGIGGEARPGIVHRLDKDTSGLLVAAKTERAMTSLARQFANHTIERAYNAVVWGAPRASEGVIEGQIGRSPFDRKRMAVLRGGGKL
ncbi:MAG: hypothetical protein J0H61_06880, partial [Alphaproteobacteria bacterium]|nr:hypothetical protein [Alphaproteobacteria bacterium]